MGILIGPTIISFNLNSKSRGHQIFYTVGHMIQLAINKK